MSAIRLSLFFIAEILVTLVVIALFKNIEERRVAGLLAGTLFLGFGFTFLWALWKNGRAWRQLSFWLVLVHLGFTSIPMVVSRLWSWQTGFHEVKVWGIPGPLFHYTAERVFAALMIATLIDVFRAWKCGSKFDQSHESRPVE